MVSPRSWIAILSGPRRGRVPVLMFLYSPIPHGTNDFRFLSPRSAIPSNLPSLASSIQTLPVTLKKGSCSPPWSQCPAARSLLNPKLPVRPMRKYPRNPRPTKFRTLQLLCFHTLLKTEGCAYLLPILALATPSLLYNMGIGPREFALHSPQSLANLSGRQGIWEPFGLRWERSLQKAAAYKGEERFLASLEMTGHGSEDPPLQEGVSVWLQRSGRDISPSV